MQNSDYGSKFGKVTAVPSRKFPVCLDWKISNNFSLENFRLENSSPVRKILDMAKTLVKLRKIPSSFRKNSSLSRLENFSSAVNNFSFGLENSSPAGKISVMPRNSVKLRKIPFPSWKNSSLSRKNPGVYLQNFCSRNVSSLTFFGSRFIWEPGRSDRSRWAGRSCGGGWGGAGVWGRYSGPPPAAPHRQSRVREAGQQ